MQELQTYKDTEILYNNLTIQREKEQIAYQGLNDITTKLVEEYETLEKKNRLYKVGLFGALIYIAIDIIIGIFK